MVSFFENTYVNLCDLYTIGVYIHITPIVLMVVNMARREKNEKRRGPKYPIGVAKREILLIALKHPDGIEEPYLRDQIQASLRISETKGIKKHLGELGPGLTVDKKRREGKNFLLKHEECGGENVWQPNQKLEILKQICEEIMESDDHQAQILFTQSET